MSGSNSRAERRREARQARKARPSRRSEELPYPLDNLSTTTTDSASWLAKRERCGATRVEMDEMYKDAVVIFPISTSNPIAEPCVEMSEFMSAAARSAVAGVEVLDRLNTEDDPHLVAALKRYVEDTGQALKEVDNRLKKLRSGLNELFPEIPLWKSLIGRRDVIAHQILNAPINPCVTIEDLEKALRQPQLLPPGWSVKSAGGKHWDVTDPADRTTRVTTDAEAYQRADGRLRWWQGPPRDIRQETLPRG